MTAFYNDWAHFAVTHDQTEGQQMAIYINGIELARGTHDFVGVGQIIESVQFEVPEKTEIQSLMLCSWSFWSEVYHKGMIDEFRIWNASKTIDEIRDNMYKPLNGDEPNLVAYYNFDDDPSIDIAIDKTGSSARPRYDCMRVDVQHVTRTAIASKVTCPIQTRLFVSRVLNRQTRSTSLMKEFTVQALIVLARGESVKTQSRNACRQVRASAVTSMLRQSSTARRRPVW